VLPHDLRRYVRIAGLGEIAVGGAANEPTFTLRIEPAQRFAIGNDRGKRRARRLLDARTTLAATATALSAATALIPTASSIVTVIALAVLASPTPTPTPATTPTFAQLLAASGLRIVGRLLL
jgi:hypothetical protein